MHVRTRTRIRTRTPRTHAHARAGKVAVYLGKSLTLPEVVASIESEARKFYVAEKKAAAAAANGPQDTDATKKAGPTATPAGAPAGAGAARGKA